MVMRGSRADKKRRTVELLHGVLHLDSCREFGSAAATRTRDPDSPHWWCKIQCADEKSADVLGLANLHSHFSQGAAQE